MKKLLATLVVLSGLCHTLLAEVVVVNYFSTTIAETNGISTTNTSIDCVDLSALTPVLPLGSNHFYMTLIDTNNNREIIRVTAVTSNTLSTVARGQDNTSARSFNQGDKVQHRLNAQAFRDGQTFPSLTIRLANATATSKDVEFLVSKSNSHLITWELIDSSSPTSPPTLSIPDGSLKIRGDVLSDANTTNIATVSFSHTGSSNTWWIRAVVAGEVHVSTNSIGMGN